MRGAISLAAALSIPLGVTERPEILLLTFGVILVTLLGQGLTLAPLLRKLDLRQSERWSPDEATARLETAQAALDRLEELEEEGATGEPVRRLRELYRGRFALCVAVLGGGELPEDGRRELKEYGAMRRELIAAERATLIGLRNEGRSPQRAGAQDRARPRPRRGADPSAVGSGGDDRGTDAGRVGLRPGHDRRARRPRARHVVSRRRSSDGAARRGAGTRVLGQNEGPHELAGRRPARDERRGVRTVVVLTVIGSLADPPADAHDAYLRLHLLSHRLDHAAPGRTSTGIFGVLNNVAWSTHGPVDPAALRRRAACASAPRGVPLTRHVHRQVPADDRLRRPGRRADRRRRPRPARRPPRRRARP